MATRGGKSRLASKEQSQITFTPLDDRQTIESIATLSQIFNSCYGPDGSCKNIHNNNGGHVTVTSQSERLLQCISFTRPVICLITTALQGHVTQFMDQGLFAGRVALHLIQEALQLGFHRHLIMDILCLLSVQSVKYLDSNDCDVKFKLNEDQSLKLTELLKLVESVIGTKPLCGLCKSDLAHICRLSVEAYLTCSTRKQYAKSIHYIQLEGYKPSDSCMVDGFLYHTPQIPVYAGNSVGKITRVSDGSTTGRIRTCVVCVSMAGDCGDFMDVTFDVEGQLNLADTVVEKLMIFADQLVSDQVGVLMCQRVVHPEVRQYLECRHVLVLDRLGSTHIDLVHNLTGGEAVQSIVCSLSSCYGYLDDIRHCVYGEKSYVQLMKDNSSVCTVVLANRSDESLAELKVVFEASQHILLLSENSPYYLAGAGCWQILLANHIRTQTRHMSAKWAEELEVPGHTLQPIIDCFTSSLMKAAMPMAEAGLSHVMDTTYNHHWCLPTVAHADNLSCSCGLVPFSKDLYFEEIISLNNTFSGTVNCDRSRYSKRHCDVIDCFSASKNALQCGVSIATMVIGIAHVVKDSN